MTPEPSDLWFLPLGGCGEIGMNLNLYGHAGQWLMVDCGVTFAGPEDPGPDVQMADPQFIADRKDQLCGLLITHAHEDHLGAVAHLWPRLECPVFATAFAAAILRNKLSEAGLLERFPLHVIPENHQQTLGPFNIRWLTLTHSTPESQALLISTDLGTIFHTGDWKIDRAPVLGDPFQPNQDSVFASQDILAMVCDSTNALEPGWSLSEGVLYDGLLQLVNDAPGRVIVACFGSNVARLHTLASVAAETGRYPGLIGRSLHTYYRAAKQAGVWSSQLHFADSSHLGYLPPQEVLAVATGSQGEPRAALHRLASGTHPDLDLSAGDTVLFSSRVIPGNEAAVAVLCDRFASLGVNVVRDEELNFPIHASGHPCQDELMHLYDCVEPQIAVPVHGEPQHMQANGEIAAKAGVATQLVGRNGDLFMFKPNKGIRRGFVEARRLGLERGQLTGIA